MKQKKETVEEETGKRRRGEMEKGKISGSSILPLSDSVVIAHPSHFKWERRCRCGKAGDHSSAPENHSTAPINHSTSPENHSTAPINHSTAPINHSTAPINHSTAPINHSTSPENHSTSRENHSTAPINHSTVQNFNNLYINT